MTKLEKVAIVIPFYKTEISYFEKIALDRCIEILSAYPIIAIKPESITIPNEAQEFSFLSVISFNNHFFDSIAEYNHLMLSEEFYSAFLKYEYILIYQLDAFVFKDELAYWCNQNIDYIGAPWIRPIDYTDLIKAAKSKIQYYYHTRFNVLNNGIPSEKQFENKVGNGGLSLRRVKKFHDLIAVNKSKIEFYLENAGLHEYNEDAFWSIEVNRKKKILNIPSYKVGLKFAFELSPERALKINNNHLPFGCHDWDRYINFWRPIFKRYNYNI